MSEPTTHTESNLTSHTEAAGDGVSDREMVETVAEQTDSASENAQNASKDWDGDASVTPKPTE